MSATDRDLQNQREIADKYENRYFAAIEIIKDIVTQYDEKPDGELGKGFTNGPFLRARAFINLDT